MKAIRKHLAHVDEEVDGVREVYFICCICIIIFFPFFLHYIENMRYIKIEPINKTLLNKDTAAKPLFVSLS